MRKHESQSCSESCLFSFSNQILIIVIIIIIIVIIIILLRVFFEDLLFYGVLKETRDAFKLRSNKFQQA